MSRIPTARYGSVSGADGPQGYGQIYTINTTAGTTATTSWTQVQGINSAGLSDAAITLGASSEALTCVTAGTYECHANLSFTGTANKSMEFEVLINGATSAGSVHFERKLGTGGDIGNCSGVGLIQLSSGDYIQLYASSTAGGGVQIICRDASFTANMVAQS